MKKVIAGMDLHSNNVVIGVMDMDGKRVASRKLPCELKEVVKFLAPFKKRLEQVAVESTYNWYWLVDGLQALEVSGGAGQSGRDGTIQRHQARGRHQRRVLSGRTACG